MQSTDYSILIVDDDPLSLKKAGVILSENYRLHFARSGEDALDFLHQHTIHLILLDITMEGISGFETYTEIRKMAVYTETPIIFLTGDASEETIAHAFEIGAVDYIYKPFKAKELQARVKNALDLYRFKKQNEHLVDIIKTHVAYVKTDVRGVITEITPYACEMFHSSSDKTDVTYSNIVGKNINILKSGHTNSLLYRQLWNALEANEVYTHNIENRNLDGGNSWYRVRIIPELDHYGEKIGYIAFYHNIDDEVRFETDAHTDYLTKLYNRMKFEEEFEQEILRVQRYKTSLSLILVDIDFFKEVNDHYGHDVGDRVLVEFSDILAGNIRETDLLARWGGEEFVILCPNTTLLGASALAENLRMKIAEYSFEGVGSKTASFGVATYEASSDMTMMFHRVDTALYQAKTNGRNQVQIYEE